MILSLLGFVIGCVFFSILGLVVLSREEMINGRNLFVFVVAAMVASFVLGAACDLLLGSITVEPLHSSISFVALLVILLGASVGGFLEASLVDRLAGKT